MINLSIIIPCYNEAKRILSSLTNLKRKLEELHVNHEIIIVDDGSTDDTLNLLLSSKIPNLKVISLIKNSGKGAAVKNGIEASNGALILFMDADGSTSLSHFPLFLEEIKRNEIVIGSRYPWKENIKSFQPKLRIKLGTLGRKIIKIILPDIEDTQCGFKLFQADIAKKIIKLQKVNRWGFDVEYLIIADENNFSVKEISVDWTDQPNSKVSPLKDSILTFFEVMAIYLRKIGGIYRL